MSARPRPLGIRQTCRCRRALQLVTDGSGSLVEGCTTCGTVWRVGRCALPELSPRDRRRLARLATPRLCRCRCGERVKMERPGGYFRRGCKARLLAELTPACIATERAS